MPKKMSHGRTMTIGNIRRHLKKYPSSLVVSIYRPPGNTSFRVMSPEHKGWLYNTRRLYIPVEETRAVKLPDHLPSKKKRFIY